VAPGDKDTDICLGLVISDVDRKSVDQGGKGAGEEITLDLPVGRHVIDINARSDSPSNCTNRRPYLVERVAQLISGRELVRRTNVTVRLFPPAKRPPDLPPQAK